MDLSNADFFGKIPASISQLTSLTSLNLSCWVSCVKKLEISNLALLVQNLTQLTHLRLDGVNLSAQGNEWGHVLSSSLLNLEELSLSTCSLSGPLDPSLSKLQSLSLLNLHHNNFSSLIPDSLAELKNLTTLRMANCGLIGTFPKKIAQSLTLLEYLDLSNNQLQGPIPRSIFELSSLDTLSLSSNRFSGSVQTFNNQHSVLSFLSLSNNRFIGIIPTSICNASFLQVVDFSNNNLNDTIPSCLLKDYLERLDLSYNRFNTTIPAAIGNLTNLRYLDLSFAGFFGQIPTSISQLTSLTSLNLTFGVLKRTFSKKIAQSLTLLETLDLSNNQLQGPIPRSIFELPSLRVLFLSSNRFRGSVQLSWIHTLQNLTWLDLSYNNLTVDANINNSSPLSTFPQLEYLYIRSCNLRTFPELGNLSELSELDLSDNNINGVVPRWIMESTTLVQLNLSHNNLVGFELHRFSFSRLQLLDKHDNQLEGNFPSIPSSSYVDFSHNNRLTGIIPTSICNHAGLEVVDFSNNYLNGTIPSCLSKDLNELSVLDLRRNMLSGNILNTFQVSCALQTLDLSNNQLEGIFPESLENCTNLEVLDIGYNKISDVFPCIQGIKSSLHVLILRNNLFHGSLWCRYGDLTTWQQLQIVDLAFNNFTGPLNDKFLLTWEAMMQDGKGTKDRIKFNSDSSGYYHNSITVSMKGLNLEFVKILTVFKSIDLSSNNFVGPIPEVIGKFKAIQVLNLSHNAFSGQIPSEFGNLSNVESLDLSHNKLTGQIPNELTGLTFLSCMDLSYNNLVGRIPTGTQFQSFDNTSFGGNLDLCGQPLSKSCTDPPTLSGIIVSHEKSSIRINWDILSKVFGFFCGLALIMLPASLWPSFRIWYWPKIDSVILWMFPKLYVKDWNNRLSTRQTRRRNKRTKATQ
ncbi:Receptor-like protein 53 [Linum perenne]